MEYRTSVLYCQGIYKNLEVSETSKFWLLSKIFLHWPEVEILPALFVPLCLTLRYFRVGEGHFCPGFGLDQ